MRGDLTSDFMDQGMAGVFMDEIDKAEKLTDDQLKAAHYAIDAKLAQHEKNSVLVSSQLALIATVATSLLTILVFASGGLWNAYENLNSAELTQLSGVIAKSFTKAQFVSAISTIFVRLQGIDNETWGNIFRGLVLYLISIGVILLVTMHWTQRWLNRILMKLKIKKAALEWTQQKRTPQHS